MQAARSTIRTSIRTIAHLNQLQLLSQPVNTLSASIQPSRIMSTSPIYTVDYLSKKLQKDLDANHIEMEDLSNCGCGMKFDAIIVSPKFEGKPILQRQRLVNQTLAEEMKHIHAFTMKTLTPAQWEEARSKKEAQ